MLEVLAHFAERALLDQVLSSRRQAGLERTRRTVEASVICSDVAFKFHAADGNIV